MTSPQAYRLSKPAYLLFNLFGLCVAIWGLQGVLAHPLPPQVAEAGKWQFLTNLSLALTIISIVVNVIANITLVTPVQTVSVLLTASALVAETLVALIYWTLKLFFLALIVPEGVKRENYIPITVDLAIHLFPVTFLSVDYYLCRTTGFRLSTPTVFAIVAALTGTYWSILETLVKPPAHYPYPFLNVETAERAKIFGVVAMLGVAFYNLYEYFHTVVDRALFGKKKTQ